MLLLHDPKTTDTNAISNIADPAQVTELLKGFVEQEGEIERFKLNEERQ